MIINSYLFLKTTETVHRVRKFVGGTERRCDPICKTRDTLCVPI